MADIYLGLVHYPIYNKNMQTVATAITNFDIHDIARTCATYDIKKYFLIHPNPTQQQIVQEILGYWQEGFGLEYNPDRSHALHLVTLTESIESARENIKKLTGQYPVVLTTDARVYPNSISYAKARNTVIADDKPVLLLFGTGWGMTQDTMQSFDYILEPIFGRGEYNHLCVRSAVAIILDRLLGSNWWQEK